MTPDDTIDVLNDLIETTKDGEYGFRASAEHIRDAQVKQQLMNRAEECRTAVRDLQMLVAECGGKAQDSGSAAGAVHRGWVAIKGTLSGYSDAQILEETERGEDVAMQRYTKALQCDLPAQVRTVVERQFEGVKRNHLLVRELRDRARAAARA